MWPDCSPAEGCAGGEHLLEDVLVAHGRAEHFDLATLQCRFQPHVGHGGCDDGGGGQKPSGGEIAGGQQEDSVAVDYAAVLICEERAVRIAIEGDSHGRVEPYHLSGDHFRMERAAMFIDVAAVGAGVGKNNFSAAAFIEFSEELGGNRAGRAVGAIDDNAAAIERELRHGTTEEAHILDAVGLVDEG